MAKIPIGLELYSVRHDLARDVRGTLHAVAKMGYEGVEFAGPPRHTAQELRAILDETGLICCGWHTPFSMLQDDTIKTTISYHQTLGNNRLIVPGIPADLRRTRADWIKLAEYFNRMSETLAAYGMVTGYHNHHVEFAPLEGEAPWNTFFDRTNPSIIMQLDTGNAMYGGGDIVGLIRQYAGRAGTVHLKPYTRVEGGDEEAAFRPIIGEDDVPWAEFFEACESVGGTEWYIVEYESDAYAPLEAVDRCLQALRAMGK
jgi:sugar phosphate isomerase/epimerase